MCKLSHGKNIFLMLPILFVVSFPVYTAQPSTFESRLVDRLEQSSVGLPSVLLPIIAQYALPMPMQPVLIMDIAGSKFKQSEYMFTMIIIGKNPRNTNLPLCLKFQAPYGKLEESAYATQKTKLIECPEMWYPEQLTCDFVDIYRDTVRERDSKCFISVNTIAINNTSDNTPYKRLSCLTHETLEVFCDLSLYSAKAIGVGSAEAQEAKNKTIVYLAPEITQRNFAQFHNNLYAYLNKIAIPTNHLSGKEPLVDIQASSIVWDWPKHEKIIEKMIAEKNRGTLAVLFFNERSE